MASKKCPKCGEDNPAEAVMCWACYTPLSGNSTLAPGLAGAPAAVGTLPGGATSRPAGVPAAPEEAPKKGIDPKIIGVGAFLVVAGLAAFFMSGAMGGSSSTEGAPLDPPTMDASLVQPPPAAPSQAIVPPLGGGGGGGAPAVAPPPVVLPFTTVTPPNPEFQTGAMGIVVAAGVSTTQAAGFARFAREQIARNGKWSKMQIAVFTDKTAADSFASYQSKRKGQPLANSDFAALAGLGVWSGAPAFLESRGKSEKIYMPSASPTAWWQRR